MTKMLVQTIMGGLFDRASTEGGVPSELGQVKGRL